ncbi:MAG: GH3 auxin-responsive promoter family protein [Prevotellaceae bacterium]|jgi:hypothetical protein|nr:GH3 auxin-responsive promoter family protein [Prevotellaceae bacterium]
MPILNSIYNFVTKSRLSEVEFFCQDPFHVQEFQFRLLITQARDTEFGRRHDFASIKSIDTYQQRVPVHEYGDFSPYIERMMSGEPNILWNTEVKWFAKSSGTTAEKSKFIPVSTESLDMCHYRGAKDVLAFYLNQCPESNILSGKGLTLGGSHQIGKLGAGNTYCGDLSAILIENAPFITDFVRTPAKEVALIPDFEEKIAKIAAQTLGENVVQFVGVPSWNLVLMRYLLTHAGKNNLLEIWPNLELFIHGGVSFTPYREQFKKIIPSDNMRYMETYNASEGFFGIQNDLNDSGMMLMLDYGIFYEFISMSEFGSPTARALTIADVKTGENYAMVITTNGGLFRYLIGDTVEFTSLLPHKIKITGRTKHYINVFGEELMVNNAESALQTACLATNAVVRDYTVAPIFMSVDKKGGHEWLIEFEHEPTCLKTFTTILDEALCAVNSDYEAKRSKNTTLEMPLVQSLKPQTFYEWMRRRGKLGGQHKVPRLFNTREYADRLLDINQNFL